MLIRDILKRMRHDGCGGRPGRAELLTGIEDWKEGYGKTRGRAETDRVPSEAHKLLDEIEYMLADMRRELLGSGRSPQR
jgi:hypothetical protein